MRSRFLTKAAWGSRAHLAGAVLFAALLLTGCAQQSSPVGAWRGPEKLSPITEKPWEYRGVPGKIYESQNYRLHTTIQNPVSAQKLVQLLEAGLAEYQKIAPNAVAKRDGLMDAYLFANRREWATFTQETTGANARLYLMITRGGYAIGDRFVAYYTADLDTWSVTAHEGFHQFCGRYLQGRLPPFLEEGLSTTFERVKWDANGRPQLNPQVNPLRAQELRTVWEARATIPLADLFQLDAGQVVGGPGIRIQAFYAQGWAFARFVREYDNGKYREKFIKWVEATASGTLIDPTGTHRVHQLMWDRTTVRPIIERYLETDTATLQREFDEWCRYLVYEEFPRQWASQ